MSAKREHGNVRAAIRLLMLEVSPAVPSPEAVNAIREKHHLSSSVLTDLPASQPQQCVSMDECEVCKAVLSFPAGSAGRPDGLRPQHIRDLLMCREAGPEFLRTLTAFVNQVLSGGCPSVITPVFWWAPLEA